MKLVLHKVLRKTLEAVVNFISCILKISSFEEKEKVEMRLRGCLKVFCLFFLVPRSDNAMHLEKIASSRVFTCGGVESVCSKCDFDSSPHLHIVCLRHFPPALPFRNALVLKFIGREEKEKKLKLIGRKMAPQFQFRYCLIAK